jgi:hypothetical protein
VCIPARLSAEKPALGGGRRPPRVALGAHGGAAATTMARDAAVAVRCRGTTRHEVTPIAWAALTSITTFLLARAGRRLVGAAEIHLTRYGERWSR